jgi:hypothetical protein
MLSCFRGRSLSITRRSLLSVLALGTSTSLGGCDAGKDSWAYRYRLTLEVETPEGLKIGSTVREVCEFLTAPFPINLTNPRQSVFAIRGEAVVVDLGDRGLLFGTLWGQNGLNDQDYAISLPTRVFRRTGLLQDLRGKDVPERLEQLRAKANLTNMELPFLARFRDPNDSTTVEGVDPGDLASSFGTGVKFSHAWIEMTDDPVSTGIEKILPWLEGGFPPRFLVPAASGKPANQLPTAQFLTYGAFHRAVL